MRFRIFSRTKSTRYSTVYSFIHPVYVEAEHLSSELKEEDDNDDEDDEDEE